MPTSGAGLPGSLLAALLAKTDSKTFDSAFEKSIKEAYISATEELELRKEVRGTHPPRLARTLVRAGRCIVRSGRRTTRGVCGERSFSY